MSNKTTYLVWKGEIIDECDTRQEAVQLQCEYNMAYGAQDVRTTTKPTKQLLIEWNADAFKNS